MPITAQFERIIPWTLNPDRHRRTANGLRDGLHMRAIGTASPRRLFAGFEHLSVPFVGHNDLHNAAYFIQDDIIVNTKIWEI